MSWPVSEAFRAAVTKSHTPTMKVQVLENGLLIAETEAVAVSERLYIEDGSISDDRKSLVGRRNATWRLIDKDGLFEPLTTSAVVHPMRDRDVRLWRGIQGFDDDLCPLATVQLERTNVSREGAGVRWSMSGSDRSLHLSRCDWRTELNIPEGTTPYAATLLVLAQVDPAHSYVVVASPTTKVLDEIDFLPGEPPDPWEAIRMFWESAAMEVFMDQLGQVKAQPFPNPATAPVARQYIDGNADNIRVSPMEVDIDRTTLRNGVRVTGSAPWLLYGVVAEAWDIDPGSPTYYDPLNPGSSLVGPHPEEISDSLVGDETEAQALADAKLPDVLGIEESIRLPAIPDPSLEAGDVIEIANDLIQPTSRFIFDTLETPLTFKGGAQTGTTRRRTR
jgi:hypothetical protein